MKLSEAEKATRNQDSEAVMKTEADKLRARALAGEPFDKLQAEAFQLAMITDSAPSTSLGKIRGENLPSSQRAVVEGRRPGRFQTFSSIRTATSSTRLARSEFFLWLMCRKTSVRHWVTAAGMPRWTQFSKAPLPASMKFTLASSGLRFREL